MNDTLTQSPFSMKGKSRLLFWLILALAVIDSVLAFLRDSRAPEFIYRLGGETGVIVYYSALAALILLTMCGMAALLVMYGFKLGARAMRPVFFALAAAMLIAAAGEGLGILNRFVRTPYLALFVVLLPVAASMVWVFCLAAFAFHPGAGRLLRVAATVLALCHVFIVSYAVSAQSFWNLLTVSFGSSYEVVTVVNSVIAALRAVASLAGTAFFFAALSFGKPGKAAAPAGTGATAAL